MSDRLVLVNFREHMCKLWTLSCLTLICLYPFLSEIGYDCSIRVFFSTGVCSIRVFKVPFMNVLASVIQTLIEQSFKG